MSLHALPKDGECVKVGREGPPAKREDAFDAAEGLKFGKFPRQIGHADVKGTRDAAKSKVLENAWLALEQSRPAGTGTYNVSVIVGVNLARFHAETRPLSVPRLPISDSLEAGRGRGIIGDDHAATGNTPIGPRLGGAWGASVRWGRDAKLLRDATLAYTLQQTLSGHGFKLARVDMLAGRGVLGTVGPHAAFATAPGIGGEPVERQIF